MARRLSRGGARPSTLVLRVAPARSTNQRSSSTPQEPAELAGQPEQAMPGQPSELLEATPDISEITFENDVAQIPVASLTRDVPLIPFISNKRKVVAPPFRFLELPSELRVKIYEYYFDDVDHILDLDPTNYKRYHKLLGFMRVCRQVHDEATYLFYNCHSFRIFPVHPARLKAKKTILTRLKPLQRDCLSTLDVRFGPGFNAPPRSWVVNDVLGLKDCVNVTHLSVFVECDPSDGIFKGFRRSEGFYETFSRKLLAQVIEGLPSLRVVEFDAWSSVKKRGVMMRGLLDVVLDSKLEIRWGPERGWTGGAFDEEEEAVPTTTAITFGVGPHSSPSFASNNLLVMA